MFVGDIATEVTGLVRQGKGAGLRLQIFDLTLAFPCRWAALLASNFFFSTRRLEQTCKDFLIPASARHSPFRRRLSSSRGDLLPFIAARRQKGNAGCFESHSDLRNFLCFSHYFKKRPRGQKHSKMAPHNNIAPNPKAGAPDGNLKSPNLKASRRYSKTPEPGSGRQVHFDQGDQVPSSYANRGAPSAGTASGHPVASGALNFTTANSPRGGFSGNINNSSNNKDDGIKDAPESQPQQTSVAPDHFPALGLVPNNSVQWHTAANPNLSLSHQPSITYGPGHNAQFHPLQQQQQQQPQQILVPSQHHFPSATHHQQASAVTYIGVQPQPQPATVMGDYQNAAPPPQGVHFQPPVPDTTFGPMTHVYMPRFDGGLVAAGVQVPGVQVGAPFSLPVPSLQFVSAPPTPSFVAPAAATTLVMPKTYYLNPYSYYASSISFFRLSPLICQVAQALSPRRHFVLVMSQPLSWSCRSLRHSLRR